MNHRIPIGITLFGDGLQLSGKEVEYTYSQLKAEMASEEGRYKEAAEYYERAASFAHVLNAPIQAQQMQDHAERERKKEANENGSFFELSK
jgi:hypothetical protein